VDLITRRRQLVGCLFGSGIELGPGHNPFPVDIPGITVRYVDRWEPEDNTRLFPELGEGTVFPQPDIIANLDSDRLQALDNDSEDFVIASHVLEHLANPIAMIAEVYRVLRPGGVLLILLPDRHVTFDRFREPTALDHLIAEFEDDVREVDDSHIVEFIRATAPRDAPLSEFLSDDPEERRRQIRVHRDRSIHAHCWDQDEFIPVVTFCIGQLGQRWEFVDALLTQEGGDDSIEFGILLRKSIIALQPDVMAERFDLAWNSWREVHTRHMDEQLQLRLLEAKSESIGAQFQELVAQVELKNQQVGVVQGELAALQRTKTFRYTEFGRRAYSRFTR